MSEDRLDRIERIVASNARAIQALASAVASAREERKRERKGRYDDLARIAGTRSNFYETQADFYRHLERMEDRQAKILESIRKFNENHPLDN